MKREKSPAARAAINARQTRMSGMSMPAEPVVSQARHGRPDEALLAGGAPWTHYGGGKRYDAGGTDNTHPADIPGGDCDEG